MSKTKVGLKGQKTPWKPEESQQRRVWGERTPGCEPALPQFPLQPFCCQYIPVLTTQLIKRCLLNST